MTETSSGYFPDAIALQLAAFSWGRSEATDIETAYNGREVRRGRFPAGGYRFFVGNTTPLTQQDAATLREFYESMRGRFSAFTFFPPDPQYYLDEYIAQASGSTSLFTTKFRNTTITAAYVGGVTRPFAILDGWGSGDEDAIAFIDALPPTVAAVVGGGSLSAGDYSVRTTFVTPEGESYSAGTSAVVTVGASGRIDVSDIPLGPTGTTARNLYRTLVNGSLWKKDITISDNTTTIATLSQADGTLGSNNPGPYPEIGLFVTADLTGREGVLVRSELDSYDRPVMLTSDYRTIWPVKLKEVR